MATAVLMTKGNIVDMVSDTTISLNDTIVFDKRAFTVLKILESRKEIGKYQNEELRRNFYKCECLIEKIK
jgi:hypothetical protein